VQTDISVDTKQQTMPGVAFPIARGGRGPPMTLQEQGAFNYRCTSHEGDYLESTVSGRGVLTLPGVHSVHLLHAPEHLHHPGEDAVLQLQEPLVDTVENQLQMEIEKKLEIDNGDELTPDVLYEEVHPKQHAHKQAFAKPKGPAGKRGGRRITRPQTED
ncbi:hypothetical protein CRUP_015280, partial [Coryphaenoides rupestris]